MGVAAASCPWCGGQVADPAAGACPQCGASLTVQSPGSVPGVTEVDVAAFARRRAALARTRAVSGALTTTAWITREALRLLAWLGGR